MQQIFLAMKIALFLTLSLSAVGIAYFFRKKRIFQKAFLNTYTAIDSAATRRASGRRRDLLLSQMDNAEGFFSRILSKPEKRYVYSRLGAKTGLSFEIWFVLKIITAVLLYGSLIFFTQHGYAGLLGAVLYIVILGMVENLLAYRNYKIVENNLLQFTNLLSNFSIASGEITGIFHRVAPYLPNPLSSVLEECYYDAQTCGDTSAAMYAMLEKIEHPLFKELILNLEVCVNYTANFSIILSNSRKIIRDTRRESRERRALARENLMEMVIVTIGLFVAIWLVEMLLEASLMEILFHTPIGHIALIIIGILYAFFLFSVAMAEK